MPTGVSGRSGPPCSANIPCGPAVSALTSRTAPNGAPLPGGSDGASIGGAGRTRWRRSSFARWHGRCRWRYDSHVMDATVHTGVREQLLDLREKLTAAAPVLGE